MNIRLAISKLSKLDEAEVVTSARFNKNYLGAKGKLKSITLSADEVVEILGDDGLNIHISVADIKEILEYPTSTTFLTRNIQILFRWKTLIEANRRHLELSKI
ncbi:MAG: hypothetical protein RR835_05390 [Peptostreptococcaceae bacterium]